MQGHIIQLSETGGEIRVLGADGTASFLAHDVSGVRGFEKLTVKCEVSFLSDAPAVAKDLKLLPPGMPDNTSDSFVWLERNILAMQ